MVSIVVSVVHRPQVAGVSSTVSVSVHTTHNGRSVVLHLGMAADIRAKFSFLCLCYLLPGRKHHIASWCVSPVTRASVGRRRLFSCLAANQDLRRQHSVQLPNLASVRVETLVRRRADWASVQLPVGVLVSANVASAQKDCAFQHTVNSKNAHVSGETRGQMSSLETRYCLAV